MPIVLDPGDFEDGEAGHEYRKMIRFIGRRVLFIAFIYVCIVFFVHLGMRMIHNSDAAKPQYGLVQQSKQAWQDSQLFLARALKGDLGSVSTGRGPVPIRDILGEAYVNSLGLLVAALVGASTAGIAIGSAAALAKRRVVTLPLLALTVLGISMPSFFAGLLLQVGELRYLAIFGRRLVSIAGFGWDVDHMLLPVLVLAARPLAYLTRAVYISLGHIMDEDYIRTAFSKGVSLRRAIVVHAWRNMGVPILTAIGVSVRFSLGSLPVVEFLFAWPGLGRQLLEAINNRQTVVVVAMASALGLTFLVTNLLLDIAYRAIDPRMREA
jgi:ABC-type dipeptide/oligopeptide/nickel transport system permease component